MNKPCPTCQRHAKLCTSSEYEDQKDDGFSGDTAISSMDDMIELCRESVKGNSDASGACSNSDSTRNLHAVSPVLLVHEPAWALSDIETAARYAGKAAGFALRLVRLTRDLQAGYQIDPAHVAHLHNEADAYLSELAPSWRGPVARPVAVPAQARAIAPVFKLAAAE